MNLKNLSGVAGGFLFLITCSSVNAVPFSYAEPPDLPGAANNPTGANLGAYDVGVNTVSGSIIRGQGDVADFFEATLLPGFQIDSILLDLALSGPCTSPLNEGYSRNLRFNGVLIANTGFTCSTGLSQPFVSLIAFPLINPGVYNIGLNNVNNFPTILDVSSYRWEISVSQVPEPASLALLGIGLAGLGFARKRKAH